MLIVTALMFFLYELIYLQNHMNSVELEKAQERVEITSVYFGNREDYVTPNQTTPVIYSSYDTSSYPVAIYSNDTTGYIYLLGNGDFRKSDDGWFLSKSYSGAVEGGSGGYTTEVTGSESGPGAVYLDFLNNPPAGNYSTLIMNLTRSVYLDLSMYGNASDSYANITDVSLLWGSKCVEFSNIQDATITFVLKFKDSGEEFIGTREYITDVQANWLSRTENATSWVKDKGTGWYVINLMLNVTLKHSASLMPELKLLVDDLEIKVTFEQHISDWYFTFNIKQNPQIIQELTMSYTSRYNTSLIQDNTPITQILSIVDSTTGNSMQIASGGASATEVKNVFTYSASEIQNYISVDGEITFRVYTIATKPFFVNASALIYVFHIETTDNIMIYIENLGTKSISLMSLWFRDYTGNHHYEIDIEMPIGVTYLYELPYNWTAGEFYFKVSTKKGTVTHYSTSVIV